MDNAIIRTFSAAMAAGAGVLDLCRVDSTSSTKKEQGINQGFYSANITTLFGNRTYNDVPILTPYVQGAYGMHMGIAAGSFCIVGYFGLHKQPYILGFYVPRDQQGTFAGQGRNARPAIDPGAWMVSVEGYSDTAGPSFRYISGTGLIQDQAGLNLKTVMEPARDALTHFCRNYSLIMPSGSIAWSESPLANRTSTYRHLVYQRAINSPLGAGGFVDTTMGYQQRKTKGGVIPDPKDTKTLYRRNVNGANDLEISEDGDTNLESAGSLTFDMTRSGETAAKLVGRTTALTAPVKGQDITITVGSVSYPTITIYNEILKIGAIAREINEQVADVTAGVDASGGLFLQAVETGPNVSLTASGALVKTLKLGKTDLDTTATAKGAKGSGSENQDITGTIGGGITLEIGKEGDSKRQFKITIDNAGNLDYESVDTGAVLSIRGSEKLIELKTSNGDTKIQVDGDDDKIQLESNKGKTKIVVDGPDGDILLESTAEVKVDSPSINLAASGAYPNVKMGTTLTDYLMNLNLALVSLNLRFTELSTHRHDVDGIGTVTSGNGTSVGGALGPGGSPLLTVPIPLTQTDLSTLQIAVN